MKEEITKSGLLRVYSKSEFSQLYLVHWKTIKKWVGKEKVEELSLDSRDRTLNPKTVYEIFCVIGLPNGG